MHLSREMNGEQRNSPPAATPPKLLCFRFRAYSTDPISATLLSMKAFASSLKFSTS